MDPDPRKEIEVDPDLDPERGLKWIRIRPNAVDPGGSGSGIGSETLLPIMIVVAGERRGLAEVDWGKGGEGAKQCEVSEAGRQVGAWSSGADTGISFRWGNFPFYKVKMGLKLFSVRIYKNRSEGAQHAHPGILLAVIKVLC